MTVWNSNITKLQTCTAGPYQKNKIPIYESNNLHQSMIYTFPLFVLKLRIYRSMLTKSVLLIISFGGMVLVKLGQKKYRP
jgi:hypothetical protein